VGRLVSLSTEDRLALADLVHRYGACVDERDLAGAAALFAPDGVLVRPDPPAHLDAMHAVAGRAEIEQALGAVTALPLTVHTIVGTVFDADPGEHRARGRIAGGAHHLTRSGDTLSNLVWHLHYRDSYQRIAGTWLISRRELHIDLIETRPVRRARTDRPGR
jgi:ketosteroid isomerase-like protein